MHNFKLIKQNIDVSSFLGECARNKIWDQAIIRKEQLDTHTINLRRYSPNIDIDPTKNHEHIKTPEADQLPLLYSFAENFANKMHGELCRTMLANLKPGGRVSLHRDTGEYYMKINRYHLVLQSEGVTMVSGDEQQIFKTGELWWFNEKEWHTAFNNTSTPRIHLIFDVRPYPIGRWALIDWISSR